MASPNQNSFQGLLILSLFLLFTLSKSNLDDDLPTVYEMLPKFGFPKGLLPSTVINYTLSEDNFFHVTLEKPCYIQFEYLVYYEKEISGKLSYGSIAELKGIQVQRFFFWFDVDEIKVDLPPSGSIYFQVGIINKKLDIDQFKTVHPCRDGVFGSCYGLRNLIPELPTLPDDIPELVTE